MSDKRGIVKSCPIQLGASHLCLESPSRPFQDFTFRKGALRLTSTRGRRTGKEAVNTILVPELINAETLNQAFISFFFIAQDEFFQVSLDIKRYTW